MTDHTRDDLDAAAMRQIFNRAAETFPHHITMPKESRSLLMAWWTEMYRAITNSQAGLAVLAELTELRATATHQPPAHPGK